MPGLCCHRHIQVYLNYHILSNYSTHANGGLTTSTKMPTSKQPTT
jgi:hypothetical protein